MSQCAGMSLERWCAFADEPTRFDDAAYRYRIATPSVATMTMAASELGTTRARFDAASS